MFRNQYDQDVVTWSPQGRIHQIEYAMEAVKQGSAAVGLKSKTHVVLATLRRSPEELSSHHPKMFKIDDHLGVAVSGLNSDGRSLSRYMRTETLNHRFVYESAMPVGRLVRDLADKAQVCTQRSWKRPYGVGLLVGGYDKTGAKLYYNCPSGNYFEYKANAVGARSQAARTYLERKFEEFEGCSLDQLIRHGLQAISASMTDGDLTATSCTVGFVGADSSFTILSDADLEPHVAAMKEAEDAPADAEAADGGAAPMES